MTLLHNLQAPTQAIVGEQVALSVDFSIGATVLGESFNLVWTGDAPGMPYSEVVGFGINILGETKTLYFSFRMPNRVVKYRVQAGEVGCFLCDNVQTPDFTIIPSEEFLDPGEKGTNIFEFISKLFGGIGGNLLWIILGLTMLLTIGYIAMKRKGKPGLTK